jgi:hypothetical protein
VSRLNWQRWNMNIEHYKSIRKKPKRNSKISRSKRVMLTVAKEWKPITTPKLREAYSTKIEWVTRIIPKLNEK